VTVALIKPVAGVRTFPAAPARAMARAATLVLVNIVSLSAWAPTAPLAAPSFKARGRIACPVAAVEPVQCELGDAARTGAEAALVGGLLGPDATPSDGLATSASRRHLLRAALWVASVRCTGGAPSLATAYTIEQVKPDEKATYAEAQQGRAPRVLWVGSGTLDARSGVYKNLFLAGSQVTALDLRTPGAADLSAATLYAAEHGYELSFEQGDAAALHFADATFDAVVCSLFLCQDFDAEIVVSEIRRVLKPGGRFGFYEHVEDIDRVVVGKVFGERAVVRIQAYPERTNVIAGVVRKLEV
jgi:hypothetical protein